MGLFDGLYGKSTQDSYSSIMSEKIQQYEAFITRAEDLNSKNGGKVTKEEAQYYCMAADVCQEIKNRNNYQPAVQELWENLRRDCMKKVNDIRRQIDPNYQQPVATNNYDFGSMNNSYGSATPYGSSYPYANKQAPTPVSRPAPPVQAPKAAPQPQLKPQPQPQPQQTESSDPEQDELQKSLKISYACKEVPEDVIRSWFKPLPDHDFSDITGMAEEKDKLAEILDNIMLQKTVKFINYKQKNCVFFYGLPGCGKTFIVEGFVAELMKRGYKFIKLMGSEVHQGIVGAAEKIVKISFQEALENAPCVLFFDEFELVCADRSATNTASHEKRLTGAFLEAYNLIQNCGSDVILMAATNYPDDVDHAMLDRLNAASIPLPDPESRINYFKRQFKNASFDGEPNYKHMSECSVNFSYRDLEKVVSNLFARMLIQAKKKYFEKTGKSTIDAESDEVIMQMIEDGEIKLSMEMFDDVIKHYTPSGKLPNLEKLEIFEQNLAAAQSN